jgi:hypothetical protein
MASSSRRGGGGRPPRDARQLDLNFCFARSDSRESTTINEEDCNIDVEVDIVNTPDATEVTLLPNSSRALIRKFNNKWKIGRCWLYWSKPPHGPVTRVMKCEAWWKGI